MLLSDYKELIFGKEQVKPCGFLICVSKHVQCLGKFVSSAASLTTEKCADVKNSAAAF